MTWQKDDNLRLEQGDRIGIVSGHGNRWSTHLIEFNVLDGSWGFSSEEEAKAWVEAKIKEKEL